MVMAHDSRAISYGHQHISPITDKAVVTTVVVDIDSVWCDVHIYLYQITLNHTNVSFCSGIKARGYCIAAIANSRLVV